MKLKDINILELYHNWCKGSGHFEAFVRSGPFVSLKYFDDIEIETPIEKNKDIFNILEKYIDLEEKALIIIDIDGTSAMEIGYKLNTEFNLWPIITFNFLLHPYGLVGDKEFISSLIHYGNLLKSDDISDVVILLDYNRFNDSEIEEVKLKNTFNNQYEFSEEDLPNVEMLISLNYKKVVYFCDNNEKEDVKYYLEYLKNNNIIVEVVSLKQGVNKYE